jgi:hypothetical protein
LRVLFGFVKSGQICVFSSVTIVVTGDSTWRSSVGQRVTGVCLVKLFIYNELVRVFTASVDKRFVFRHRDIKTPPRFTDCLKAAVEL